MNEVSEAQGALLLYHGSMEVNEMKYLKVFTDFLDVIAPLTEAEKGRLFEAMLAYALNGQEPSLSGNERFLWAVAKQNIDRERVTYEGKVASVEAARHCLKKQKPDKSKLISDEDKDKEKENDKDNDKGKDVYIGAEAPAPKAHIYKEAPTLGEIESYCRERGNQVDPQYFFDYYEANGWRMGKTPMKDWRAAVRSWENNGKGTPHKPSARDAFLAAMEQARWEEAQPVSDPLCLRPC